MTGYGKSPTPAVHNLGLTWQSLCQSVSFIGREWRFQFVQNCPDGAGPFGEWRFEYQGKTEGIGLQRRRRRRARAVKLESVGSMINLQAGCRVQYKSTMRQPRSEGKEGKEAWAKICTGRWRERKKGGIKTNHLDISRVAFSCFIAILSPLAIGVMVTSGFPFGYP
ncbi:hypothetical protein B0H14DRAFT_2593760 [Mycena olivaceomarginata]|nr:hypothetical protein B0H14DRAFT_2593760 [Mycena olivaceomarginata]